MARADQTLVFRILHVDNIELLAERRALHSPSAAPDDGRAYRPIHNQAIQLDRGARPVPCGPGGQVRDYVSFYFGRRGPMLYQISRGDVPGFEEDQSRVLYAVSSVERLQDLGLPFVFTDGHSLATFTRWYDDPRDLSRLDWEAIEARWWRDTDEDNDRQRRKQAELLVHRQVPWEALLGFAAISHEVCEEIRARLARADLRPPVAARPGWYY